MKGIKTETRMASIIIEENEEGLRLNKAKKKTKKLDKGKRTY